MPATWQPVTLQRVDRFDDDIAHIVTNSAKRSGLTFAPEAGTQVGARGMLRLCSKLHSLHWGACGSLPVVQGMPLL